MSGVEAVEVIDEAEPRTPERGVDEWRFVNEVFFFPSPRKVLTTSVLCPAPVSIFIAPAVYVRTLAAAPESSDAAEGAPAGEFRFSSCKKGPSTRSAVDLHRKHT